MTYQETAQRMAEYRTRIASLREEMQAIQRSAAPEPVADYQFTTPQGTVSLSQLFGGKRDLIVIHNMGTGCVNCTMWADGFNGLYPHIADRAAFVVSSPDAPAAQQKFAADRGWRFPMVSHADTSFAADMGYRSERGGWLPGLSVFRRDGDRIVRVADTRLHPGDDFCSLWHMFDMLPDGAAGWHAKYSYA